MPAPLRRLVAFYALQLRLLRTWRLGRRALFRRLVLTAIIGYVAFGVAVWAVPGITVNDLGTGLVAIAVLALINALIRPVVLALFVPLGIVVVIVAGIALQFVAVLALGSIVPGLVVRDFTAALQGALIFAVVNAAISWFIAIGEDESYFSHLVRRLIRESVGTQTTAVPGVLLIQIDGLAHPVLVNEIRAGRVPTMARWLRTGTHRLTPWECQLPSQTSASQAGILLGANDGIPAFRWFEKETGRLMVSNRPEDATEIERRLSTGIGLLTDGGSSIGNLVSGDASESILTVSRLGERRRALGPTRSWFYFVVSPFSMARAVFLTIGEAFKELWQARRQRVAGIEPRISRGGAYPILRAVTNVFLRQVSTSLVIERMLRGVPVLYVDFVDYDEIAHHAGPERSESLASLEGLDSTLRALERVAAEAPRPYKFVVLSDHGQSQGSTFRQRYGVTLEQHIRGLIGGAGGVQAATAPSESWGPINAFLTELSRGRGMGAKITERALRTRSHDGSVALGPAGDAAAVEGGRPATDAAAGPELVVCASGNLALVYLNSRRERLTLESLAADYPGLLEALSLHEGIGFVLVRSERFGAVALGPLGANYLDERRVEGTDPLGAFGPFAADHLRRLDAMAHVGDLVLNSRIDPDTQEIAAFEELVGSHGGIGGWQTSAFVLHPAEWPVAADLPIVGAPALHRVLARWLELVGVRKRAAGSAGP